MNIITKSIYKYTYNLGLTTIDLVVYSKVEKMFFENKNHYATLYFWLHNGPKFYSYKT